ncbi:MAG: AtpZ/AtpI family protein [Anaeromyxobacter sp.]
MAGPSGPEQDQDDGLSGLARGYRKAEPYLGAAYSLVGSVAGFSLLGYWLDSHLHHETPWCLLGGALFGMVGGFISFFRIVLRIPRS